MAKIDNELIKGCQRYLDELEKRTLASERLKEEQRKLNEQQKVRREYWRKILYESEGQGLTTLIVPDQSV